MKLYIKNLKDPIDAIIFDWDNTLVKSLSIIHDAMDYAIEKIGKDNINLNKYNPKDLGKRRSSRETFPLLFGKKAKEASNFFYNYFEKEHLKNITVINSANELLFFLKNYIPLFINSNKNHVFLKKEIEKLGLASLFVDYIGAGIVKKDKPSPLGVEKMLQKHSIIASKKILYIGDSITDVETAKNAKITSILITDEDEEKTIPLSDFYFKDLLTLKRQFYIK